MKFSDLALGQMFMFDDIVRFKVADHSGNNTLVFCSLGTGMRYTPLDSEITPLKYIRIEWDDADDTVPKKKP